MINKKNFNYKKRTNRFFKNNQNKLKFLRKWLFTPLLSFVFLLLGGLIFRHCDYQDRIEKYKAILEISKSLLDEIDNDQVKIKESILKFENILDEISSKDEPDLYGKIAILLGKSYANYGEFSLQGERYFIEAIFYVKQAQHCFSVDGNQYYYNLSKNYLAHIYLMLSNYRDKYQYCNNSIKLCRDVLKYFNKEKYPKEYADTICLLGAGLLEIPSKNNCENISKALSSCQEALKIFNIKSHPIQYGLTQNILGLIYSSLNNSEKEINLRYSIECYEKALKILTIEKHPFYYAIVKNNIGLSYLKMQKGDKDKNINKAIECFNEVLSVVSFNDYPSIYSSTYSNLGLAYYYLYNINNNNDDADKAIEYYKEALKHFSIKDNPYMYAIINYNLGNVYLDKRNDSLLQNKIDADLSYKEAEKILKKETYPYLYALLQFSKGRLYLAQKSGTIFDNVNKATVCFRNALNNLNENCNLLEYTSITTYLSIALLHSISGNRENNINEAINYLEKALTIFNSYNDQNIIALIQSHLGSAYLSRSTNSIDNIDKAIYLLKESLKLYDKEEFIIDRARVLGNLGSAYLYLSYSTNNIDTGIDYILRALKSFKRENNLELWAMNKMNLGSAYLMKSKMKQKKYIDIGTNLYKEALKAIDHQNSPYSYSLIMKNLCYLYYKLYIEDEKRNSIAVQPCQEALKIYTIDYDPIENAIINSYLGAIYAKNGFKNNDGKYLEISIDYYNQSIKAYRKDYKDNSEIIKNLSKTVEILYRGQLVFERCKCSKSTSK